MPINEKQFKTLIGGYGFESFEPEALELFNNELDTIMHKSMSGGRVSFVGDYFANPSNNFTTSSDGANHSMSVVTDTMARPSLEQTFKVGGFHDDKVFESALKHFRLGGGAPSKLSKVKKDETKNIFKGLVEKVFSEVRKVASKTKLLKATQVKRAVKKI